MWAYGKLPISRILARASPAYGFESSDEGGVNEDEEEEEDAMDTLIQGRRASDMGE